MQIGVKFSIAIHILLCIEYYKDSKKLTGDFIAASVKSNPVTIRNIMALLRNKGIIGISLGTGGAEMKRPPSKITMLTIYSAIYPVKEGKLFKIHEKADPKCPVGSNINAVLSPVFINAQREMEAELDRYTLADLLDNLNAIIQRKRAKKSLSKRRAPVSP